MTTPRSNIVKLRLTDLEKADWQKAAGGARRLSEFIREAVNAECERRRHPMQSIEVDEDTLEEVIAAGAEAVARRNRTPLSTSGAILPDKLDAPAAEPFYGDRCPRAHAHRPGVYCGTCKTVAQKVGE